MSLEKVLSVSGRAVPVPGSDIDTDRIIPARFMKCVTFDELGQYAFYDARFHEDGSSKGHPLDDPRFQGASILLSGVNFGCGSSREHAPQSLYRFGIRAVIAESFAEIFFGNCTTLGIPAVVASGADIARLMASVEKNPQQEVVVDVEKREVRFAEGAFPASISSAAYEGLTEGRWDSIAELLANQDKTAALIETMPHLAAR